MGKKKKKRGKSLQQTIFKFLRIGALAAPGAYAVMNPHGGDKKYIAVDAIKYYTGYNMETGEFHFEDLAKGWTPFLAATLVTYGVPKIAGILRRI